MKKSEMEALMEKNFVFPNDIDYICNFISEIFEKREKELEETEPYAIKTINRYKEVAYEVYDLINYYYEIMEGEDE